MFLDIDKNVWLDFEKEEEKQMTELEYFRLELLKMVFELDDRLDNNIRTPEEVIDDAMEFESYCRDSW